MSIENWEHFFKPEVRSSGRNYLLKGQVSLSRFSDSEIQCYVRASTSFKVTLKSPSIENPLLRAACTCPPSRKGQFCKHLWAALIKAEENNADFLEAKKELEVSSSEVGRAKARPEKTAAQAERQEAYKKKQNDYRKAQYQKQKERLAAQKRSKQTAVDAPEYPGDVEKALAYFLENGFPLRETMDEASVRFAMKKLAHVFHPDKGGRHDEIQELNRNTETLLKFSDKYSPRRKRKS